MDVNKLKAILESAGDEDMPGDVAITTLVRYFSGLTKSQNVFFSTLLDKFQIISKENIDFQSQVMKKIQSLEQNLSISKEIIKSQKELADLVKLMQKSLENAQKFNKEAIFEFARQIASVNVTNSDSSPIPTKILEDLNIAHAVQSKVTAWARLEGGKKPSVVELSYSDGSRKRLTISRDSDGSYVGHSLEEINK